MIVTAERQNFFDDPFFDLYLYLANVKTHLANHSPMDRGDENAWLIADMIQGWEVKR